MLGERKVKILVVDDHEDLRKPVEAVLTQHGYDTSTLVNGQEAVKYLETHRVDIIISDVEMPYLNGFDFCKLVKNHGEWKSIYFILLTIKDTRNDIIEGLNLGADDYITKPFDINELLARVNAGRRILELQQNITRKNQDLETAYHHIQELQNKIIVESNIKTLADVTSRIAHELNTQFQGSKIALQNLETFFDRILEDIRVYKLLEVEDIVLLNKIQEDMLQTSRKNVALHHDQHDPFFLEDLFLKLDYDNNWLMNNLNGLGINDERQIVSLIVLLKKYEAITKKKAPLDAAVLNRILFMKSMQTLRYSFDTAAEIIGSLRNYSKPDTSVMGKYGLQDAIEETLTICRFTYQQGILIRKDYEHNLPDIICFPGQIRQVITNLLTNAAESIHGDDGKGHGQIMVKTRTTTVNNIGYACVEMINEGEIPEHIREIIFKERITTKKQGSGFGLNIINTIIKNHNGKIEFESGQGKTTFRVYFPFDPRLVVAL